MYKVFVDHKPIIFIHRDDFHGQGNVVDYNSVKNIQKKVKKKLINADIENPVYLISEDVEKSFEEFFQEYVFLKAAGGLVQRDEEYLIIKRNGMWDIPKGKLEKNEKKKAGAIREVEEECGIIGPIVEKHLVDTYHVCKHKRRRAIKRTNWYLMSYTGPKETIPQENEGITKAKWVSRDKLFEIRKNTYGSINEVLDAFASLK